MYHVSTQGIDERMINVHYYYYYYAHNHTDDYSGTLVVFAKSTFQLWSQVLKIKLLHCHKFSLSLSLSLSLSQKNKQTNKQKTQLIDWSVGGT